MASALGFMLPAAVAAIALSLPAIMIMILLLEPGRDRAPAATFAVGWLASFAAVGTVFLLTADRFNSDPDDERSTWVALLLLAIGLALIAYAGLKFRKRPRRGEAPPESKLKSAVAAITPVRAVGLGAILGGLNPKFLAVIGSFAAELTLTTASGAEQALAMALFIILASAGVLAPLVATRLLGSRADASLSAVGDFMGQYTWLVMVIILAYFGVKLIGDALPVLF